MFTRVQIWPLRLCLRTAATADQAEGIPGRRAPEDAQGIQVGVHPKINVYRRCKIWLGDDPERDDSETAEGAHDIKSYSSIRTFKQQIERKIRQNRRW